MLLTRRNRRAYEKYKEQARALVRSRLEQFAPFYGVAVRKVFIKNHKSRWGSCSERGNLNFNYKVVHLPPPVVDYIVVHELCHLIEFNHSPAFWALVARAIPDHRRARAALRALERAR